MSLKVELENDKMLIGTGDFVDHMPDDDDCCCQISDLMPCGEGMDQCWPGHKVPCNCEEGCDFHIRRNRAPKFAARLAKFERRCKRLGICPHCGELKHEGDCKRLRNSVSIENMLRNAEQAKGK